MPDSQLLAEFRLASEAGNERVAASRVLGIAAGLQLDERRLQRLSTAVAEATLNAIEHGNAFRADRDVEVRVQRTDDQLRVSITDSACAPTRSPETPDLARKLAGEQSPRGWGMFLMRQMVDTVSEERREGRHTVHLAVNLK
jgi:anti-sigma regulatory factor (Ser/Thr protein kinase)